MITLTNKNKNSHYLKSKYSNLSYFSSQGSITPDMENRLVSIFNANLENQSSAASSKKVAKIKVNKQIFISTMDNGSLTLELFKDLFKQLMSEVSHLNIDHDYNFTIYIVLPMKTKNYRPLEDKSIVMQVTDEVNKLRILMKRLSELPKASKIMSNITFIENILLGWRNDINYTSDTSKIAKNVATKITQSWTEYCVPLFNESISVKLNIYYKKLIFIKTDDIVVDAHFINISRDHLINSAKQAKDNYDAKRAEEKAKSVEASTTESKKKKSNKSTKPNVSNATPAQSSSSIPETISVDAPLPPNH